MSAYIALLRGINVGGHNKIKMPILKTYFENLGFTNVVTYIQSGNVVFTTEISSIEIIENKVTNMLQNYFKTKIEVLVIKKNQLEETYNSNPFLKKSDIDIAKLYVTFLNKIPTKEAIKNLDEIRNSIDDVFIFYKKTIFIYCINGYGNTKLSNTLFEKKLNITATTRNWKTVTKLIELSAY